MKYKKILVNSEETHYWSSGDFHSKHGTIKEQDILTNSTVKTHLGKVYKVLDLNFLDKLSTIKRGPQIPLSKDVASIIYYSNLNRNSKVLDAGSGSGFLALNLARFAKEVVTYEKNKHSYEIVKENIKELELDNIKVINKDISELEENNFDVVTLDLLEPEKVITKISNSLVSGGTLIVYLPNLTQVYDFKKSIKEANLIHLKTVETIEREWDVFKRIAKPLSTSLHSGFIVICRKL